MIFEHEVLSHTLYYNILQVFEQRSKILTDKFPSEFVEDVIRRTDMSSTNYNMVKKNNHLLFKQLQSQVGPTSS